MPHALQGGVIPAAVMPFRTDASVDWETFDRYIASLADAGVPAIGHRPGARRAARGRPPRPKGSGRRLLVVSGLIAPYTADAVAHAARLVEAGADGLVVFPPLPTFASKSLPVSIVVDYHAAVAEAVGVPLLAFQTAIATYPAGTITALSQIDGLVAIKDAAFDIDLSWELVEEARETQGRVAVMTGNDTFVLEAMLMGCDGALVGLTATFTSRLVEMQRLAAAGRADDAYAIWNEIGPSPGCAGRTRCATTVPA